ncbi:hemocytin-like isoform X3 [Atheta coriaria]
MFLDWCHKDICGGHPELACSAISSYARECLSNGFCVNWHSDLCPQTKCPDGQQYQTCGTSCPVTCDSIKNPQKKCNEVPTSGCFCPEGKVMQNNTCIEEKMCITCDEHGHHPGDKWTKDACTTCECEGSSIRCETKHCPAIDTLCEYGYNAVKLTKEKDECCEKYICIPSATASPTCDPPQKLDCAFGQVAKLDTKSDGCQQFVCECLPPEECAVVDLKADPDQEVGMTKKIKDGGCCPTVELVCDTNLCPAAPKCDEFYSLNKTDAGKTSCCPEYKCVAPESCIVDLDHIEAENGGERQRSQYEKQKLLKQANDTWNDGPCRSCKCYGSKSTGFHSACTTTECPLVTSSPDYAEYDLLIEPIKGECCPEMKRSGCKYNSKIYHIGEKWTDEHNPCTKLECVETKGYGVQKLTQIISCDESCDIGYEYVPATKESHECCGSCKAIGCVVDGKVKSVGTNWTSEDFCMHYTCLADNGTMQVQSLSIVCPEIAQEQFDNFVYEFQAIEGECCKKHKMSACKVGDTMYMIGQSWPCPDGDQCKTYTCVETSPGVLKKQESIKTCDTDCPLGWEYVASNVTCCGECVQRACVVENTLKSPGVNWTSADNCTTFTCENFLGQFTVSSHQVSCPQIDDCPPENVYTKGCCEYCNVTALAMGDCVPQEITGKKSLHYITAEREGHGVCKNIEELKGFTECVGTCHSATLFNKVTGKHESVCSCCRALDYKPLLVELTCQDGYKFKKPMSVPSKCGCEGCSALKNPLLQAGKGVKGIKH